MIRPPEDKITQVSISFPVIEIHGNAKSRGAGGPAEKDLERHRLKIDPRRSKNNKSLISLTMKVSLKFLMIRNPKDFGVWSACPSGVYSVITKFEMLPKPKNSLTTPSIIDI